jgi:hypothetical protein
MYCPLCTATRSAHAETISLQFVKVGFAGEHFPVAMFPSMVGRPTMRYAEKIGGVEIKVSPASPSRHHETHLLAHCVDARRTLWLAMRPPP